MKDIFLVDMDETLLDFPRTERENLYRTLLKFGIQADEKQLSRFHEINDSLWKKLERGEITRARLILERFEIFFQEYGFQADIETVAKSYYAGFQEICFPYDGALEFIKALSVLGRVYIVTNGSTLIQERHIEDAGFLPYIEDAFISEEIGFNKPSMEYADYVEARIENYQRDRAIWIGDSLTSDGKCACGRGIDFILYAAKGVPEGFTGISATNYQEVLDGIKRL